MKSVFVVTFRWLDIVDMTGGRSHFDTFPNLEEAEAYRDKLRSDQEGMALVDEKSKNQLEVLINRYDFNVQISREVF